MASSSSGGDGQKYDASNWLLQRKYDQLVMERDGTMTVAPKEEAGESIPVVPMSPEDIELLPEQAPIIVPPSEEPQTLEPKIVEPVIQKIDMTKLKTVLISQEVVATEEVPSPLEKIISEVEKGEKYDASRWLLSRKYNELVQEKLKERKTLLLRLKEVTRKKEEKPVSIASVVKECKTFATISRKAKMWLGILLILLGIGIYILSSGVIFREKQKTKKKVTKKKKFIFWTFLVATLIGSSFVSGITFAADTTPSFLIYEGTLMNSSRVALSGSYSFRFSFWSDRDYLTADVAGGVINSGDPRFLGWQEVQTQTLDAQGQFSFENGERSAIGFYDLQHFWDLSSDRGKNFW